MQPKAAMAFVLLILLVPFAHAQSTNLQPLWDAISDIQTAIQALQNDVHTIQTVGLQFAQTTETRLTNLEGQVSQIMSFGQQFLMDTNYHFIALEQKDENLQQQINAIQPPAPQTLIARNKIYEVVNNNPNENTAYCNSNTDILLFGYCTGSSAGELIDQNFGTSDSFSDGDYTNNPAWAVETGSGFSANGFELSHISGSSGGQRIITDFNPDYNAESWIFKFRIKTTQLEYYNGTGFSLGNQQYTPFSLNWQPNGANTGKFLLQKPDDTIILASTHQFTSTNTYYSVELKKDGSLFELKVDGVPEGSTNYSDSTDISRIGWTANWGVGQGYVVETVDDLNFSTYRTNPTNSAIKNLDDLNGNIGFVCRINGSARVMCLQQP